MASLHSQRARTLLAIVAVIAALAAACSSASPVVEAVDDVAEQASAAPTTPVPTELPTTARVEAPTATRVPAATAAPVATPTPVPSATRVPTVTPEPTATTEPAVVPLAAALEASSLQPVDCPAAAAAAQITCAVATVPLDPLAAATGQTITLMTAQIDNGDPNDVGPVVFLQGGPGVGSVASARAFVGAAHDVILVDQRGTGFSTPKLDCPETDELWVAQFTTDPAVRLVNADTARIDAYRQCGERLSAAGVSFDAFNTTTSAADFELIRQLMGHESWSLWGISYGTRLGLTLMREYPQGIRAAVLDSVVPFEVDFFATLPENAYRSMVALDQACDVERCAEDHGDFLENLAELTRELNENPVVVSATRPVSGAQFPFLVRGRELIDMVFIQLYSTRALPALPRQIDKAEFGGLDELVASYMARRDPERIDLAVAMYYTTWCREEFPFFNPSIDDEFLASAQQDFGDVFARTLSSDGLDQVCNIFPVAPAAAIDDQPLSSAIPTIVFAGAFDPITPPAWSRQAADALGNATFVQLADHGHGMATDCPASIRLAFLTSPNEALDISCATTTNPPDFE